MFENLEGYRLILASNSPRRKELMGGLGLDFVVKSLPSDDESWPDALKGAEVALHIAKTKASHYKPLIQPGDLVITADTIVCVDNEVLGKPVGPADARRMLRLLSGRSHFVYTGVCLSSTDHQTSFTAETEVFFSELTDAEIDHYITQFKPYDKAGAYGIQEWIGFAAVESIRGSYFNVMGLPVHKLYTELLSFPPLNPTR